VDGGDTMRKHRGLMIFGIAVVLACIAYLGPLRAGQRARDEVRGRVINVKIGKLAARLDHARESDVTALAELSSRFSEVFPPPGDRWIRFGQEGVSRLGAVFRDAFEAWHARLLADEIITPRAWPRTGWRESERHPTDHEMRKTLRLCLLVEGLGRILVSETGGIVTGITELEEPDEVVVKFMFEPDRVRGLLEALTGTLLGGEPFELLNLETKVRDTGPGTGSIRLRMVVIE
jgi:hypothetical protein